MLRRHDDGRVWFHTGDVATMDEDGYTSIVQRKKDMIIVDGFNVYPSEVEGVLYTHAGVRMVGGHRRAGRVSRRSGQGLRRAARRRASRSTSCGRTARRTSPPTKCRSRSSCARACRRARSARSCIACCATSCSQVPQKRTPEFADASVVGAVAVGHFLSSSFAIASRCTSSGPSARRIVRACAQAVRQREVVADAGGAVRLNRAIEHAQRHARRDDLDLRDLRSRRLVADRVHQVRGVQRQQPRLIDLHARLGDVGADRALLRQRLAERDARLDARAHRLERALGRRR